MKGQGRLTVVIDCQLSGISGDMMLGALLAVGADELKVKDAIESVKDHTDWCKEIIVKVRDTKKGEFIAKAVDIDIKENPSLKGGGRACSQLRDSVMDSVKDLKLSDPARTYASRVIDTLIEAEERIHGKPSGKENELHELGSTDTIADVVGVAAALDDLKIFAGAVIYSTPVAVGGGLFRFSHGVVQSPGPVALEILRKFSFPLVGGPVERELVTPTGASLVVNVVTEGVSKFYPDLRPSAVGYGAGKMDLGEVPNMLRVILGSSVDYGMLTDSVYVLETNLDDVGGETIGFLTERLLNEKVRDVCVVPIIMKKGRPGQMLKVIVDEGEVGRICRLILNETGTLGVRSYPVRRYIATREVVPVEVPICGETKKIRVKIGKTRNGEITSVKPEYEDVSRISIETGKPFREIEELVKRVSPARKSQRKPVDNEEEVGT